MFTKPSPRPSLSQPLKRSDSIASELEIAFLKQPFLEQRLERKHQRTSRKCLRFEATGRTSVVHTDKLQIAEQTGIQLRDLRLLDPQLATSYPSAILARDAALVLNLEFVKAVVTRDCVLILNPEEQNAITFVETLSKRLGGEGSATEVERDSKDVAHGGSGPAANSDGAAAAQAIGNGGSGAAAPADSNGNGGGGNSVSLADADVETGNGGAGGGNGNGGCGGTGPRPEEDQAANSPFELRALEVALDMACRHLAEQTADLEAAAHPALDALTRRVTTTTLERVRRLKTRLVRLKTRVETMKELLAKLLDDDEDMLDLHLTAKAAEADARTSALQRISMDASRAATADGAAEQPVSPGGARDEADEEARARAEEARASALDYVEQLLEAYFMQVSSTESKLATLYEYVDDTEDYIDIEQDEHRNQLIRMDLLATAAMISLSIITVVTGWFAMNLNNTHPSSYPWFYGVSFTSIGLCVVSYLAFLFYCWHKKLMFQ